ncbi:hypothetical protein [Paenibacillus wynnii]|uniref:Uncharacterized protein n=1 Tax=Paenibacillus wynnii TaxID=268407 RepID=A0A098MF26_9BACL|nr:hypothetical protein [Paenibacillus wynnii]KGE18451.1 hypothetical protein PWYN_28580 [Paenibacillus wynnii]KGE20661.1 hypothetical protein PWYN_00205 [Paenibacillus wynnii]
MRSKLIQDDEQYDKAQAALLDMAAKLDDPLSDMPQAERDKINRIYDKTADLMRYYRRGRLVEEFPGLGEKYAILGQDFQEFEPQNSKSEPVIEPVEDKVTNTPRKPETLPVKPVAAKTDTPKATVNLSNWL